MSHIRGQVLMLVKNLCACVVRWFQVFASMASAFSRIRDSRVIRKYQEAESSIEPPSGSVTSDYHIFIFRSFYSMAIIELKRACLDLPPAATTFYPHLSLVTSTQVPNFESKNPGRDTLNAIIYTQSIRFSVSHVKREILRLESWRAR